MIKKLYKKEGRKILYWEAWNRNDKITFHWGNLGDKGETTEHEGHNENEVEGMIKREVEKYVKLGYREIPLEEHVFLTVEFKLNNWGTESDLEKKRTLEEKLDQAIGWTGNGMCDGGDIGSGYMAIFLYVVDTDAAKKIIISTLKEEGVGGKFVIKRREGEEDVLIYP